MHRNIFLIRLLGITDKGARVNFTYHSLIDISESPFNGGIKWDSVDIMAERAYSLSSMRKVDNWTNLCRYILIKVKSEQGHSKKK